MRNGIENVLNQIVSVWYRYSIYGIPTIKSIEVDTKNKIDNDFECIVTHSHRPNYIKPYHNLTIDWLLIGARSKPATRRFCLVCADCWLVSLCILLLQYYDTYASIGYTLLDFKSFHLRIYFIPISSLFSTKKIKCLLSVEEGIRNRHNAYGALNISALCWFH